MPRLTACLILCYGASIHAQSADEVFAARARLLRENTSKLERKLQLDRDSYLTGETAQITITIRNPTAQLLEVFEPFTLKTGGFVLEFFGKVGRDTSPTWQDYDPDPPFRRRPVE